MGIRGVTISDVRGFGAQGGSTERQGGKLLALRSPKTPLIMKRCVTNLSCIFF